MVANPAGRSGNRLFGRQREISNAIERELKGMEERVVSKIIPEKFVGSGIKRTSAYETNLVETEFNEVREQFWSIAIPNS